jgi:hypothetical protein
MVVLHLQALLAPPAGAVAFSPWPDAARSVCPERAPAAARGFAATVVDASSDVELDSPLS